VNPEHLGVLNPGIAYHHSRTFPRGASVADIGAILRFRDAAGIGWIRHPDGDLSEQE